MPKEASQHASGDVSGEGTSKGGKMPGSSVEWAGWGCRREKEPQTFLLPDSHKWRAFSSPWSQTTVLCISITQNQWTNHRGLKSILSSLSCLCQVFVTWCKVQYIIWEFYETVAFVAIFTYVYNILWSYTEAITLSYLHFLPQHFNFPNSPPTFIPDGSTKTWNYIHLCESRLFCY